MKTQIKHPAKYSDCLLPIFDAELIGYKNILDPFAGTGKLKLVRDTVTLLEIEPEWAAISGAIVGDATDMPFFDDEFDAICTSPTYGNRMGDAFIDHQPHKNYKRNTYTHALGRKLSSNNTGGVVFGDKYKQLHIKAWAECFRVLKPYGKLILNISNFIRNGKEVDVIGWHISELEKLGFKKIKDYKVETKRNRFGANRNLRVNHEYVIILKSGK